MKQITTLEVRNDPAGQGHYGAPRGDRKHRGVDFACQVESPVLAPVSGIVTKIGLPYADSEYRYVEIAHSGYLYRVFYVEPSVNVDDQVQKGRPIGVAQDVTKRYPGQGMTAHVHLEVKDAAGNYYDPDKLYA